MFVILRLRLDIVMIPLIIRLSGKVTLSIPFFGIKKTLYKKDLWRYQANPIHSNIFNTRTKEPDESPPEIMVYSTPVVSHVKSWFFFLSVNADNFSSE